MRTNALSAIPALVGRLKDKDYSVSSEASLSLAKLRALPEVTVPAFAERLEEPNPDSRYDALVGLRQFGRNARKALPSLLRKLDDPETRIREDATNLLSANRTIRRFNPSTIQSPTSQLSTFSSQPIPNPSPAFPPPNTTAPARPRPRAWTYAWTLSIPKLPSTDPMSAPTTRRAPSNSRPLNPGPSRWTARKSFCPPRCFGAKPRARGIRPATPF